MPGGGLAGLPGAAHRAGLVRIGLLPQGGAAGAGAGGGGDPALLQTDSAPDGGIQVYAEMTNAILVDTILPLVSTKMAFVISASVSYTHLDVYKRQMHRSASLPDRRHG